ncbi:hypothetical protein CLIM01_15007 [Colletotrichum limetticola]|uniref:Uncharacterized protein n=1 Tax=Colletotrichum limetticola TaxID=1209924 RepID=A0ABQ9PB65_9PEZI|nr:hypothetical protein CLIM01_15007 [Colletotrichum limetticola]
MFNRHGPTIDRRCTRPRRSPSAQPVHMAPAMTTLQPFLSFFSVYTYGTGFVRPTCCFRATTITRNSRRRGK